jgi:outer membrane protein assembly factor BamB
MKLLKTGIFVLLFSTLIYTQGADMLERALFGADESRNMISNSANVPSKWDAESGANVLWRAALGSQTYTNPTIVGKNLFIATNNEGLRNPKLTGDRGVLMAFEKEDGNFLWQATHEKLPSGLVNDWPLQGICSTPYVEGKYIYYVSNRCEVVCIDAEGFLDGENDGPYTSEVNNTNVDADIIWIFDMMDELDVFPHNLAAGSPLIVGDILYTVTGNGVDESHILLPSPAAPSFIALNKNTGELIWEDNSPGENILHGTWSNPAYGVVNNTPQVVFPGGDGWLYSFEPETGELIWKFNCNPEGSVWKLGGSGTKNNIISTPVFYDNKVYLGVGQDPEHGEAPGHFWVIDASGKGDITKTGVVWRRSGEDFYRTMSTAAIANDLLFISDLSGFLYCLDPQTGEHHWTYDTEAAIWGSPMAVDNKVYLGDEDGDVVVFKADKKMEVLHEVNMGSAVYSTPVAKDGVLYIASRTQLYAIKNLD